MIGVFVVGLLIFYLVLVSLFLWGYYFWKVSKCLEYFYYVKNWKFRSDIWWEKGFVWFLIGMW